MLGHLKKCDLMSHSQASEASCIHKIYVGKAQPFLFRSQDLLLLPTNYLLYLINILHRWVTQLRANILVDKLSFNWSDSRTCQEIVSKLRNLGRRLGEGLGGRSGMERAP